MKRLVIITIIVVLCFAIWGCSSQAKSQYNKETNQHVTFQGISFQVPISWKKPDVKFDEANIAFSQWIKDDALENYLALTFFQGESLGEHLESMEEAKYIEIHEQSVEPIANMPTKKIRVVKETNDGKYNFETIILQTEEGVIQMSFNSINKEGYSDFDKVVDSITVLTN